jgi:predicted DNA-binding ribbon-helix-helix protein
MKGRENHELVKRNIAIAGIQTTIVLEHCYWTILQAAADKRGITWQLMCQAILRTKPSSYESRPGYLRLCCTLMIRDALRKATRQVEAASTGSP